jgi:uncharacterized protein
MNILMQSIQARSRVLQLFLHHGYHILKQGVLGLLLWGVMILPAHAAADLDVNTAAVAAVRASMQNRHSQLLQYYQSGAVGLTAEGFVAVKDAGLVPLSQRSALAALVKDENMDRVQLYHGIAVANGHPEWEGEIQRTFALRWIDKAQPGWFVQREGGWVRK